MVVRRGDERIQLVWPLPLPHRRSDNRRLGPLVIKGARVQAGPYEHAIIEEHDDTPR